MHPLHFSLSPEPITKERAMKELLLPAAVLAVWFVVNAWVLPRFGVET